MIVADAFYRRGTPRFACAKCAGKMIRSSCGESSKNFTSARESVFHMTEERSAEDNLGRSFCLLSDIHQIHDQCDHDLLI